MHSGEYFITVQQPFLQQKSVFFWLTEHFSIYCIIKWRVLVDCDVLHVLLIVVVKWQPITKVELEGLESTPQELKSTGTRGIKKITGRVEPPNPTRPCINVLTYLLTYISSTIGCANFGPDWPLLFKVHEIWSVDSQENHYDCCHQMPDFNVKMHHNRFRLGLCSRPRWGSLQRSPRPPSWI